ncbi:MAG: urea transporter [Pseudomonas sp.]
MTQFTYGKALLNGCSQIFLQQHPLFGALVLLAIAIGAPDLLGGALLGGLSAALVARRRNYAQADIDAGLYTYNGVLLGLMLCNRFAWSALLPLLIIASAGASSLVLKRLMHGNRHRQWLPAFTAPFVGLSWLVLSLLPATLAPPLQQAAASTPTLDALGLGAALLKGVGQVIFLGDPLAGAIVLLGLALASRRAALWAVIGSAIGLAFALQQGWSSAHALNGLYGYNGVLVGVALSLVYRNPAVIVLGILLALPLQPGFAAFALPELTAPFILACWLVQATHRTLVRGAEDSKPKRIS